MHGRMTDMVALRNFVLVMGTAVVCWIVLFLYSMLFVIAVWPLLYVLTGQTGERLFPVFWMDVVAINGVFWGCPFIGAFLGSWLVWLALESLGD